MLPYMPEGEIDGMVGYIGRIFGDTVLHIAGSKVVDGYRVDEWLIASVVSGFNVFVWVISGIVISLGLLWQIGSSANKVSQESKGKLINEPMRNILGISLLMPTGFGFNVVGMIVLVCSMWGIKGANDIYNIAIKQQLKEIVKVEASYIANQNISLDDYALNYIKARYCANVLNASYSKGYGMGDDKYANLQLDSKMSKKGQADINGTSKVKVSYADMGQAGIGKGIDVCGYVEYESYERSNIKTQVGSTSGFASGNKLLGHQDEKFLAKINEVGDNLRQQVIQTWSTNISNLSQELNIYLEQVMPLSSYDEKNKNFKANLNLGAIRQIIDKHNANLTADISKLTQKEGYMKIFQDMYIKKMQQGGILEMIGYRQHFSQIRQNIINIITKEYIKAYSLPLPNYQDAIGKSAIDTYNNYN